jgi:hypothetical protein
VVAGESVLTEFAESGSLLVAVLLGAVESTPFEVHDVVAIADDVSVEFAVFEFVRVK